MDIQQLLGESIRNRIFASNYRTEEKFAHENDIKKSTLSELLNGKNNPKLTTLAKIASGLEITLSELLRGPEIDSWVREKAPKYDSKAPKSKTVKGAKKIKR